MSRLINGQAPWKSCVEDAQGEARRKSHWASTCKEKTPQEAFRRVWVDTVLVIL